MRIDILLTSILACAGCNGGGDVETTTETASSTATGAPTEASTMPVEMCEAAVTDCCCFTTAPIAGVEEAQKLVYNCPLPEKLCAFRVEDYEQDGATIDKPTELTCALEALRDRTAGYLSWEDVGQIMESSAGELFVQADGTAFAVLNDSDDVSSSYAQISRVQLKPPDYFAGCLALTDDLERFACLKDFEGEVVEVCVEAFKSL